MAGVTLLTPAAASHACQLLLTLLLPVLVSVPVPVCLYPFLCLCVSSVTFNYLGRDFFNALSEKDVDGFKLQLIKYLMGFCFGESAWWCQLHPCHVCLCVNGQQHQDQDP